MLVFTTVCWGKGGKLRVGIQHRLLGERGGLLILFGFLCFLLFVFVLCLVSTVAHVSGLSILDCPFGFL